MLLTWDLAQPFAMDKYCMLLTWELAQPFVISIVYVLSVNIVQKGAQKGSDAHGSLTAFSCYIIIGT